MELGRDLVQWHACVEKILSVVKIEGITGFFGGGALVKCTAVHNAGSVRKEGSGDMFLVRKFPSKGVGVGPWPNDAV